MTQDALESGTSTFPPGLRLSIYAGGIEEMQEKAVFWRVRTTQLEPGGPLRDLEAPNLNPSVK